MGNVIVDTIKGTLERVTGAVSSIDNDHKYIHKGLSFNVSHTSTAGNTKYSFEPSSTGGSDKYIHFRPARIAIEDNNLSFEIWEGSTSDSTGTELTAYNRNRISSNENEWVLRHGDASTAPTSTGDYKKVDELKIFGGTGPGNTAAGAESGQPIEWVLKQDKKYVFNVVTSAAEYSINFFWYEEDEG